MLFWQNRVTLTGDMKGITIKLPEATLRRLRHEARATGRSIADLVRGRLDTLPPRGALSVHEIATDLAGSLEGGRKSATNRRRRFVRP